VQVATFVIAVLGLVVSVVNATWSVAQWKLNGARPAVELIVGAVAADGSGLVSMPVRAVGGPNFAQLARQGFTQPVVGVTVTNSGRLPVRVQRWALQCGRPGMSYVPLGESIGPSLPYVLEAGAQETWVVDLQVATRLSSLTAATTAKAPEPVTATVELAAGESLKTKQSLRVA
jgi:hypothetical protein